MGKKKAGGVSHGNAKKVAQKVAQRASKYEELTELNDRLLAASALTPSSKELESNCQLIFELVEHIRANQNSSVEPDHGAPRSREDRLAKFVSWCNECGLQSEKVELALYDGLGVGVRATQKIQYHEMFLCIPRSMIMMTDYTSPAIGQLLRTDPIASRMSNIALALYLLSERFQRSSSWKPYIDALPESYDTPLYFTPSEISLLKGSATYEQSANMQRNIARQYAYFWALFVNQSDKYQLMAKHFTYDLYRWAVSTVMTRQNIIPANPSEPSPVEHKPGGSLALIPFWDMCNHKQGEMLTDYDEDLNECHCYANVLCEPGDQVFICYSSRPNSDFLVHNGFVYDDNPNDTVILRLGLAKTDPLMQSRKTILAYYGMDGDVQVFFLCKRAENLIPHDLITFLRVFNATQDEIESLLEQMTADQPSDTFKPISDENYKKCWTFLKVRCSLILRTYTGEFADTESQQVMNPQHVSMAQRQLQGEKCILNEVIKLCDSKLEV